MMQNTIRIIGFCTILFSCFNQEKKELSPVIEENFKEESVDPDKLNYIMGLFDPQTHPDFVVISNAHASRDGMYLRKEAYEAFRQMVQKAETDGVKFTIRSATRNFDYQKGIWERKWTGKTPLEGGVKANELEDETKRALKILLYSSMPGTSRHHWGTDIDLNSFDNDYFASGKGKKEYDWLKENASNFGFCQPYTDKRSGRTGYEEERWHWSYMPLSADLTKYSEKFLKDEMIKGFIGSDQASKIGVVSNYVLGVNNSCFN